VCVCTRACASVCECLCERSESMCVECVRMYLRVCVEHLD